ncbi:MAG: hypothetical protein ACKOBW_14825, partial [Planctomycetota bacterium]
NAAGVIEPGYRPSLDPFHATDAEIDKLVLDEKAREVEIRRVAEMYGAESSAMIRLRLGLALGGLRVGNTALAHELLHRLPAMAPR